MAKLRDIFRKRPHKVITEALEAHDPETEVLKLLDLHPDFDVAKHGGAMLAHVAELGYAKVALRLLEKGVDVNYCYLGWMPLHSAANAETARVLLAHGARVNETGETDWTPLMSAMYGKNALEVATVLLEHGADVNAHSRNGDTVLYVAAGSQGIDVVKLLLKHGANPEPPRYGHSALSRAMQRGKLDIANLLNETIEAAKAAKDAPPKPGPKQGGLKL